MDISATTDDRAILHVSARPLSPRFPHPLLATLYARLPQSVRAVLPAPPVTTSLDNAEWSTTYHVVLEPLVLGVLPKTAVPAVWAILVFVLGAALVVPSLIRALEKGRGRALATEAEQRRIAEQKDKTE